MDIEIFCNLSAEEKFVLNNLKKFFLCNNIKAYIVGGAVRDAFLKKTPKDIDICVENDLEDFIYKIPYVKQIRYFERFKTSSLRFNNGVEIDIIRCRKEKYLRNGELPKVYPSSIKDDLYRRDFTINAIAYDMVTGEILDPYGGIHDIKNKSIKSIKEYSYIEDPTRIFRAIKYSQRYKFRILDLEDIINSIEKNVFSTISNDRIIKEIILMAEEEQWENILKSCSLLKIMDFKEKGFLQNKLFLIKNTEYKLCDMYVKLNNSWLKEVFKNNSILNINLRKAFKNYVKVENDLLKARDNYTIFSILKKCDEYLIFLLSYNEKLTYKIINYLKLKDKYNEANARILLNLGIGQGKKLGDTIKYINSIRLNSLLNIDEEYLINNIGEIINDVEHKNT